MDSPFTQISPSLVWGFPSSPSKRSKCTQTAPNESLDFLDQINLSKLGRSLDSTPPVTLQQVLEACTLDKARRVPAVLGSFAQSPLKLASDNSITYFIHSVVESYLSHQPKLSNLSKIPLVDSVPPTLTLPPLPKGPLLSPSPTPYAQPFLPLSSPLPLAALSPDIVNVLSAQSIDFSSNWQYIRPAGPYFLLFNYFTYQVYRLGILNNLLTVNQGALERAQSAFPDPAYLIFSIALILIYKLLPGPLAEVTIEFLVNCFGKTRRNCDALASFDDRFRIETSGYFGYRLLNEPSLRSHFDTFFMTFRTVFEEALETLRDGGVSARVFAGFLDQADFPVWLSSLTSLVVQNHLHS